MMLQHPTPFARGVKGLMVVAVDSPLYGVALLYPVPVCLLRIVVFLLYHNMGPMYCT